MRLGPPVADLGLFEQALEVYEALERDQGRWPTLDMVEEGLDGVAANPGSRENRLRRFQDPPSFAVPVATPEGDWLVLWREVSEEDEFADLVPEDVHVLYVGGLPD